MSPALLAVIRRMGLNFYNLQIESYPESESETLILGSFGSVWGFKIGMYEEEIHIPLTFIKGYP